MLLKQKNYNNVFKIKKIVILTVLVLTYACTNDDGILNESTDKSSELVSVTHNRYVDNELAFKSKHIFNNKKLTKIEFIDHSYDLAFYTNELISKIERYDSSETLWSTITYTYDNQGKLTNKTIFDYREDPLPTFSLIEKQIEYVDDKIKATLNFYDANHVFESSFVYILTLGTNGLIAEQQEPEEEIDLGIGQGINPEGSNQSMKVEYTNGNPSRFVYSGGLDAEITYTYSDSLVSDAYQFKKYIYGREWKNNHILNKLFNLGYYEMTEINDNYLTGFTYTHEANTTSGTIEYFTSTTSVTYEFDTQGNLSTQTKVTTLDDGSVIKNEDTYEYNTNL